MIKKPKNNPAGFSFMETMISVFIFSLIALTATAAFLSGFSARNTAKAAQRNLEEARTAMEMMAKNMRMSTKLASSTGDTKVIMFNNSQGKCIEYSFENNKLRGVVYDEATGSVDDPNYPDCSSNPGGLTDIISIPVVGQFSVVITKSIPFKEIGKATISMSIGEGNSIQHIQTTVSFRDFKEVLPGY